MSFSSEVKDELSHQNAQARHCQIAEVAAIISLCGRILISSEDKYCIKIHTENIAVARKYFTLLKKTFQAKTEISIKQNAYLKKSRTYTITVINHDDTMRILKAVRLIDEHQEIGENLNVVGNLVVQQLCCKRAFIRGAFLATGSVSDPEKSYHFEIVCAAMAKAQQLQEIIAAFHIEAKIIRRKRYFVVYIKEGAQIVDILNVMEAHVALMNLENVRILKDMRNSVNRRVNCEAANINKTVSAAVRQVEDIHYIQNTIGLEHLTEGLTEIAIKRLEQPEATLKELGMMLHPPVGKSGVNHRLRKLGMIAEALREERKDNN